MKINLKQNELRKKQLALENRKDELKQPLTGQKDIELQILPDQPVLTNEELLKRTKHDADIGLGDLPWHLSSVTEVLNQLVVTADGLNDEEHAKRLKEHGLNQITPTPEVPLYIKFLLNLVGGFQIFLWLGSILSIIAFGLNPQEFQSLALAIICFIVVFGTAIFTQYQEGKADDVMAALRALTPSEVFCLRNGVLQKVLAETLVPGDIVHVKSGEKVPADLRVLSSIDLKVNNSQLTGENVDIKLNVDSNSETIYDAKNIARMGCNFTSGNGVCVVFATGDLTFFGSIAAATTTLKRPDSCLKKELKRFVITMGMISVSIGITFLILAIYFGYEIIDAIIFMIGIIVSLVPEGLLPQMTVALTITAQRMRDKEVVVTNLEIIESLGAVNVICSDKTGTLTCNRMTVVHVCYDKDIYSVIIQ